MKKKETNLYKKLPMLKVYKDDLYEIAEVFQNSAKLIIHNGKEVSLEINADDYILDDINELESIGKSKLKSFSIRTAYMSDCPMFLKLNNTGSYFDLEYASHMVGLATMSQIERILEKRVKQIDFINSKFGATTITLLAIGAIITTVIGTIIATNNNLAAVILASLLTWLAIHHTINHINNNQTEIILTKSNENTGFFDRNRETIYVELIKQSTGIIIGYIIGVVSSVKLEKLTSIISHIF